MRKKNTKKKGEEKRLLMNVGRKHYEPLKHIEFKCPKCNGIATVYVENDYIRTECHACGTWGQERI